MTTQSILLADPPTSRITTFNQRVQTHNLTTITILLHRDICFEYRVWHIIYDEVNIDSVILIATP
jgi:hypothetical protein